MTPTMRLRLLRTNKWSETYSRDQPVISSGWAAHEYKLQQWWEGEKGKRLSLPGGGYSDSYDEPGEWRDVPVVEDADANKGKENG